MALINRFSTTTSGSMIITGNTLGLSGPRSDGQQVGTIRVFSTLNLASQVPGYPAGTTTVWQDNESTAELNIPAGSTVLYAELQWGGTSISVQGGDVSGQINTPITFTTPAGSNTVSPDPATSQTFTFNSGSGPNEFYSRSNDVTTIVQGAGSGTYSSSGVPAVVGADVNGVNAAGWTLIVVYSNPALDVQNMTVFIGLDGILGTTVDIPISGFLAPATGPVSGRILVSAMEGDPGIVGDQMLFGPDTGSLLNLSGPNNLSNNFFASQINDGDSESATVGQLDTSGTFGTLNSTPGSSPPQGVRQGWDITNVESANFFNNQTEAVVRLTTAGDAYAVPVVGIQLDAVEFDFGDAPDISAGNGPGDYSTLLANNGPRHGIQNQLLLGTQVTPDPDGRQNSDATGDDIPASIQDDGVILPLAVTIPATTYILPVSVTNATGSTANIYGWIDFNRDGIFQTIEGATATVPTSITNPQSINLTFTIPGNVVPGTSFARVRVTTDTLVNTGGINDEDTRSLDLAIDGEVEDYEVAIEFVDIVTEKFVDPAFADLGDTISYTVNITNTGTATINNVFFQDTIPSGTTFVNGSLTVSTPSTGTNPQTGITINTITPAQVVTLTWNVILGDTLPSPNPVVNIGDTTVPGFPTERTNSVTTQVNNASVSSVKIVDPEFADIGETITYTVVLINNGNVSADNVVFIDTIPNDTTYVNNSLNQDGTVVGGSSNPPGVTLPNSIAPGATSTVTFQVTVDTIPSPNPIVNVATASYEYTVDPSAPRTEAGSTGTNEVDTFVNVADLGSITKSVDKDFATCGDTLTYTVAIPNSGNVTANNVMFVDTIPNGTTFVSNSFTLNGVIQPGEDPQNGVNIGSIAPGAVSTITFNVTIDCQ